MSDVTLSYKGEPIVELDASGSKTFKTAGKYCEADIELEYTKNGGYEIPFDVPPEYQRLEYLEADTTYPYVSVNHSYSTKDIFAFRVYGAGAYLGNYSSWNAGIDTTNKTADFYGSCSKVALSWEILGGNQNNIETAMASASGTSFTFGGAWGSWQWTGKFYYLYILRDRAAENSSETDIIVEKFVALTLIPVYRIVDGVNGFYDTVNDVFYTAVQGAFVRGPEIN